jgi:hypothetical protein
MIETEKRETTGFETVRREMFWEIDINVKKTRPALLAKFCPRKRYKNITYLDKFRFRF